ncbi:MAG: TPR-domain containing protein [Paenibacillus sp.]|nr:TPR-domain containing protein [Paenibacillus sp.]
MLEIRSYQSEMLEHGMTSTGPIPTAQDPDGVYPYESFAETSRRSSIRLYQFIALENAHIRVVICPDLGGKVYSMLHKASGKEVLHHAPIVRPIRILPRQFFVGGGIEVSFPISHTPVQIVPLHSRTERIGDRCYVWCGEQELRFGMQWTVEYSLGEDDAHLTQRTVFNNPTPSAHPWMSWSNAGVPVRPDTEYHYPKGPVLYHGEKMDIIDWEKDGPRKQEEMNRMAGYFWREPDCGAFGAFTPSLGSGLYHVADRDEVPGMKLWTDGIGPHEAFVTQYTLNGEQCLEIQAGPIIDQSIKQELEPGVKRSHTEFWVPTDRRLSIYEIPLPEPKLIPLDDVPLFPYRSAEASIWLELLDAHSRDDQSLCPQPPIVSDNRWAPSGMEQLEAALIWACKQSSGDTLARWRFQLGAWYAGCDRIDEAIEALVNSGEDRAEALAARLYRRVKKDARSSAACYSRIQSQVFALHPQVVFERDMTLALLGVETLAERERWLTATSALTDEWLVERRAALAADKGNFAEAKQLLENTTFQLVHQRYARTRLWKRIMIGLGLDDSIVPDWLGEDDLFVFGAYREYDEDEENL